MFLFLKATATCSPFNIFIKLKYPSVSSCTAEMSHQCYILQQQYATVIISKLDTNLERCTSHIFEIQCLWKTSVAPLWVSKAPNCFNQLCAHSILFMWHLVRSLDPTVSRLENVRRQVHSSILRPMIHLLLQVWEPPPGWVYFLLRRKQKGPVGRIWKPTANLANTAIKSQSCQWPKRWGGENCSSLLWINRLGIWSK